MVSCSNYNAHKEMNQWQFFNVKMNRSSLHLVRYYCHIQAWKIWDFLVYSKHQNWGVHMLSRWDMILVIQAEWSLKFWKNIKKSTLMNLSRVAKIICDFVNPGVENGIPNCTWLLQ
jgi:hypothetical protein